jgi:hypothetical protein
MARRAWAWIGVVGEHDGLDRSRPRGIRLMADRADRARVGFTRRYGRIGRVRAEWSMTRLAADALMRIGFARLGDVGVAVHARELPRIDDRTRRDLRERPRAIVPEPSVVRRYEKSPQYREYEDTGCE